VLPRLGRPAFCGECETSLFPTGFFGEGFLVTRDIDSSSVNFVVTFFLKVVQALVVVVEGSYTSTFGFSSRRAKGHETQNDTRLAGGRSDERHVGGPGEVV
jgi:hypothetical protein